jgi:hypothetical protein
MTSCFDLAMQADQQEDLNEYQNLRSNRMKIGPVVAIIDVEKGSLHHRASKIKFAPSVVVKFEI